MLPIGLEHPADCCVVPPPALQVDRSSVRYRSKRPDDSNLREEIKLVVKDTAVLATGAFRCTAGVAGSVLWAPESRTARTSVGAWTLYQMRSPSLGECAIHLPGNSSLGAGNRNRLALHRAGKTNPECIH